MKPKLPKLTRAALNSSSSATSLVLNFWIKTSDTTGYDFLSNHMCSFGPVIMCRPTIKSCTEPVSIAEPCVPVEKHPAIVCPLLAPEVFNDLLFCFNQLFNSCIEFPHWANKRLFGVPLYLGDKL